jgi:hypothetical protein
MHPKLPTEHYDWSELERTREFIRNLFAGEAPDRPAAILHAEPDDDIPTPDPPAELDEHEAAAWKQAVAALRRPLGSDDFVPTIGTNAGTCAIATAFGAREQMRDGVHWVEPSIDDMAQVDRIRKPALTDGRLGDILERTRAARRVVGDRIPIRVMDFQSPFTTVEQLVGCDRFFTLPYDEPERLHALMDVVTDFSIEFFTAQIEAAGDSCCRGIWPPIWFPPQAGIQMSDDHLASVSPSVYREFVVPYNNRIAEAFGGMFLHSCVLPESHLEVLADMELTGFNCDISSGAPLDRILGRYGREIVIAPHSYINDGSQFTDLADFVRQMLGPWRPGHRLFIYPCTVLYLPKESREIEFDEEAARAELRKLPAWNYP